MSRRPRLLLDTNVWLDNYLGCRPGHEAAANLLSVAADADADLLVALVSLKDLYYVLQLELKRARPDAEAPQAQDASAIRAIAWAVLDNLADIATVVGGDASDAWLARRHQPIHDDFEDDLVIAAALRAKADFLVTSDKLLLEHAPVATQSPASMAALLKSLRM